jgi:hypothetical protein
VTLGARFVRRGTPSNVKSSLPGTSNISVAEAELRWTILNRILNRVPHRVLNRILNRTLQRILNRVHRVLNRILNRALQRALNRVLSRVLNPVLNRVLNRVLNLPSRGFSRRPLFSQSLSCCNIRGPVCNTRNTIKRQVDPSRLFKHKRNLAREHHH